MSLGEIKKIIKKFKEIKERYKSSIFHDDHEQLYEIAKHEYLDERDRDERIKCANRHRT